MKLNRFLPLLTIAAAAGSMASCAVPSRRPVQPPKPVGAPTTAPSPAPAPIQAPAAPAPTAPTSTSPASNSYTNSQYGFTCAIPDGFILTHESEGPGEIMLLVPQSLRSNATANVSVRAAALGRMTLEQYMDFRVTRDLQGAANVTHWDKFPASYGAYAGFEVVVERQYASGPFKSRIFGFSHGSNVFLINYSASADEFDANQTALERLLESLSFTP